MSAEKRARELDPEDYIRMEDAFEQFAEGRDLTPDTWGVSKYVSPYVDNDWDVWRKAWAAALTPQWAEISTAPRDGSRIMLWDSRDGGFPTFGSWRVGSEEDHGTITHWLPLPTPPEGEA